MTRAKKSGRSVTARRVAIGLVAAAACGLLATLLIRNFGALGSEAGGSCGTRRGPCPNHWGLIFALSFFPLMILVPAACYGLYKLGRLGWVAGPVAAAVCVYPGWLLFDVLHGPTLRFAWSAPSDRGSDTDTEGVWITGDAVVRGKFDGLTAYAAGTGEQSWNSVLPGRDTLCAMSRTVEGGVGLIAHEPGSGQCGSLAAIDTATGRTLWNRTLPTGRPSLSDKADSLAIAGTTGAYRTNDTVEGFAVRDGKTLWKQENKLNGCSFEWVAGTSAQVLLGERCTRTTGTGVTTSQLVRALDPATGRELWKTDLRVIGNANVDLVHAAPLVLAVRESDARGKKSLTVLDAQGRVTATIPTDDPGRSIDTFDQSGSAAVPSRKIAVSAATLVAVARADRGENSLVGYRLSDGRRLWTTGTSRNTIDAIAFDGKNVVTLTSHFTTLQLRSYDSSTGEERTSAVAPSRWNDSRPRLLPSPAGLIIASSSGRTPYHPLTMLPRP
ncbi:PQQ-binding-like beta-propeller repeat protein [Actinomadura decatromicini]|uniref:PQQ-binding-like beta-propeller repeat protein n=1 Tax=Actinomadura decatromicini TaxID=2604572 RepID=A0A5D3FGX2_9ACTN|nr:PQQ-binding-like beta-propeller repeat protein [Actinomadura decatromicini]TYK47116.1 PQQ-binding-like beta-propeller repeat protein [Actinomadura decatromicini]